MWTARGRLTAGKGLVEHGMWVRHYAAAKLLSISQSSDGGMSQESAVVDPDDARVVGQICCRPSHRLLLWHLGLSCMVCGLHAGSTSDRRDPRDVGVDVRTEERDDFEVR